MENMFDDLTAGIVFTDLIAAMGTVYAGIIGVGLFLKGAQLIARRLGWS